MIASSHRLTHTLHACTSLTGTTTSSVVKSTTMICVDLIVASRSIDQNDFTVKSTRTVSGALQVKFVLSSDLALVCICSSVMHLAQIVMFASSSRHNVCIHVRMPTHKRNDTKFTLKVSEFKVALVTHEFI